MFLKNQEICIAQVKTEEVLIKLAEKEIKLHKSEDYERILKSIVKFLSLTN